MSAPQSESNLPLEYHSASGDVARDRRINRAKKILVVAFLMTCISLIPFAVLVEKEASTPIFVITTVAFYFLFTLPAFVLQVVGTVTLLVPLCATRKHIRGWIVCFLPGFLAPRLAIGMVLILNDKAASHLKKAGYKVGLMGAKLPY